MTVSVGGCRKETLPVEVEHRKKVFSGMLSVYLEGIAVCGLQYRECCNIKYKS